MPLRDGYSIATVRANMAALMAEGESREAAAALSFAHARKSFFSRHADGVLPVEIAFPRRYRTRAYYDENGMPLRKQYRENPAPLGAPDRVKLRKAARLYTDFTGEENPRILKIPVKSMFREGLVAGELLVIGYKSTRDGKAYAHEFRKSSRPLVLVSHDGKQVAIVGGRFTFTDAGFEDR